MPAKPKPELDPNVAERLDESLKQIVAAKMEWINGISRQFAEQMDWAHGKKEE